MSCTITIPVDSDGVVRHVRLTHGDIERVVPTSCADLPDQGHYGPDGTSTYGASIAECVAADWDAEARVDDALTMDLCVTMAWSTNGSFSQDYLPVRMVGERSDLVQDVDAFASSDEWPRGPGLPTDIVSPYCTLAECRRLMDHIPS